MVISQFFIDRPIFAWVIAIVIVFVGTVAALTLPIAQYPEITPPTVQVSAVYPGANSQVVADTVAAPIEQQINGVERMLYMSSQSSNDGTYTLTVTFELGTDLNMAQVLVQNRVQLAMSQLPEEVQRQSVSVKKKSPDILLVINLFSSDHSRDQLYLSNYATIQLKDELARIDGVGDVTLFGQQDYSMRVWLNPDLLAYHNITAPEVVRAIKEQNVQVAAGAIGQEPVPPGQAFQLTLSTLGRLQEVEQFENIIVKVATPTPDGKTRPPVRLKDVARVELSARNQDIRCILDGKDSVGIAIFQLPGSNALDVADRVRAKMKELSTRFPSGVDYGIYYDTTPFIRESVDEVFNTLRDAVVLVAIVVLLFLQDWKSMILPLIDVPVSLIGTFAVMSLLGFSLNNLTLFGLVLAIGIVVDDAIVVLENIENWMERGLAARAATIKAMSEITGPIISITLVLSSVFLPSAFLPGITGQFYKQFALTISVAMIISAVNAMTLTPSRAVVIFGNRKIAPHAGHATAAATTAHHDDGREALPRWGIAGILGYLTLWLLGMWIVPALGGDRVASQEDSPAPHLAIRYLVQVGLFVPGAAMGWWFAKPINRGLSRFFKMFNRLFDLITRWYGRSIAGLIRFSFLVLLVYAGLVALTYHKFTTTPVGFIPPQDKGYLLVSVQLPDAASIQRTDQVMQEVTRIARSIPGVDHTVGISGTSVLLGANGSYFGTMFVVLEEFALRSHDPQKSARSIAFQLQAELNAKILDATIGVFGAPPVSGLGSAGGFKLMVQDRGDLGPNELQRQTDNLAQKAAEVPGMVRVLSLFRANIPQLYVDVDREKCKQMGVRLDDVFATLQVFMGSAYVNDFNRFGRTWQVNLSADMTYRVDAAFLKNMRVRNDRGDMVPLGTIITVQDITAPATVSRYNMYPTAPINGVTAPELSSGETIALMERLAKENLPAQMAIEWTELFYMQILAGNTAVYAFLGAVVLVYLVLAAQYESWSMPLAVLLVVPMCVLCSLLGIGVVGLSMDIFVQVGFIVLVGLAAKNAILIVEFARQKHQDGMSHQEAAIHASEQRLRPIVMTSFAFILGVVPLVLAHGAGSEMRKILGIAVFSGMLGVTFFGVFLTPIFYYVIARWTQAKAKPLAVTTPSTGTAPGTEQRGV